MNSSKYPLDTVTYQKPPHMTMTVMIGALTLVEIVYTDTKKIKNRLPDKTNTFLFGSLII